MRIRRLFSSVLAGLALMYASGCNTTCQQVAGYNVYGNPYGAPADMQSVAYNAAFNPGYNQGPLVAQPPAAVTYNYPQTARAPKAVKVKRSKARYARPTKQRFTQQVNPYVYGQPYAQTYNQAYVAPQTIAPASFATPASLNVVPTITTNTDGVPGLTTAGVANDPVGGIVYQPTQGYAYNQPAYVNQSTFAPQPSTYPQPIVAPVQAQAEGYNYGIPSGSNVQTRTVYRRGRPVRNRYRKVRWVPIQAPQPVQQVVYQPPMPEPMPYTAPIVMEPYTPPAEPIPYIPPEEPAPAPLPEPVPAPEPEPQVIRQEINTIINPVIEPQIKPLIEPTIRTRIEPAVPVEQPMQQPIIQPVVIQPIIQPVIQAPIQSMVAADIQMPEPVYQQQPVYAAPPPPQAYVPPAPVFPEPTGTYCPPDVCPVPNPVVCQPGQNLSECFTLNEYQIMNTPTQIYTPSAAGILSASYDSGDAGTANWVSSPAAGATTTTATVTATPMGQTTTSKYEALPMADNTAGFGVPQFNGQMNVPAPLGRTDNIPPVPAATEIENALDAMLARDQMTPNLR